MYREDVYNHFIIFVAFSANDTTAELLERWWLGAVVVAVVMV